MNNATTNRRNRSRIGNSRRGTVREREAINAHADKLQAWAIGMVSTHTEDELEAMWHTFTQEESVTLKGELM